LGTGNDLELYHDGSNSYIRETGTGDLVVNTNSTISLNPNAGGEYGLRVLSNGAVESYYDNSKKLETTSAGATITGALTVDNAGGDAVLGQHLSLEDNGKVKVGTGDDLQIYHDGTNSYLDNGTGALNIRGGGDIIYLKPNNSETALVAKPNAEVELLYDNSTKFETKAGGVQVHGNLMLDSDNDKAIFGAGNDLEIYHDGSSSRIYNATGDLVIRSASYNLNSADGTEPIIVGTENGAVELYHNNTKRVETTAYGTKFTNGRIEVPDESGHQIQIGAIGDFTMEHDGSNTYLKNITGNTVIQNDAVVEITASSGGTKRFRFDSDGLKFGTDTAAANALDDYEEGTWTPTFQYWDGSAYQDVTFDDALNYTFGYYVKVGNLVHVWYYSGQFSTDSGMNTKSARISGLPFVFKNTSPYYGGNFHFIHTNCFKDDGNNLFDCHGAYAQYNTNAFYPSIGNSSGQARWGSESGRYLMMGGTYQSNT